MKIALAALMILASHVAMADSESYPAPLPTGVYGTSRPSTNVQDTTGSEQTPVQPKQTTVYRAANCVNGVDQNTGEALVVCKSGGER